ncbi:MAG: hypothetical protein HY066_09005 [Betaproteobacteria bacterium]|nr:hypothetical protein [Betaproteobacteria bacterium]
MKNTKNTPDKYPDGELVARIKASRKGSILTDQEYHEAIEEGRDGVLNEVPAETRRSSNDAG